jgi:uncharacterized spore protein YtfJ
MSEVVEGEPIHVGGHKLVPVARVTTHLRRHALIGSDRLAARGWGFVRMQPIAIVEQSEEGKRHMPIQDKTHQALSGFLLAAFIIPLLLAVAVHLARKR